MIRIRRHIANNRQRDAKSVKEQSYTYDAIKKEQINESVMRNKERKYIIRKQESLLQKQRRVAQEKRLKETKQNYDERIRAEFDKIKQRETALAALKQEEMTLVMKLQNTQVMQSRAFTELEALLKAQQNKSFLKERSEGELK